MIAEYIRLTKITFGTDSDFPPVFLFDEIQQLCISTNISAKSTFQYPAKDDVLKQLLSRKKKSKDDDGAVPVEILVWLSLERQQK